VYEYNNVYEVHIIITIIHLGQEGLKMDQERETKIRAWIKHGIDSGRAIVRPAGFHKVSPKNTFQQKLDSIKTLAELEGFANRRKYLPALPRWTENERAAIIHKKTEMQNVRRKRK
jgi:hypothetical protein